MAVLKGKLALDVGALSEEVDDTIIPDGETWEVFEFQGVASYLDDTASCLVWDATGTPELLECTHGDGSFEPEFSCVGDGVKVLRISLQNDTNTGRVMSGKWKARKIS
jgi:hypothetical protein